MNNTIVSVCMITYNHENFIREAIDGVLMQKTDFPIELIIGEDCSTDGTRKIVMEYARKYPDIIRPLLPDSNLGMMKNFIETMQAATGKYIALCEGDDYWTDPYKLQKQVDFLEANEEYSLCCHRFNYHYQINNTFDNNDPYSKILNSNKIGIELDLQLFEQGIMPQVLTVVFRKEKFDFDFINQLKFFYDVPMFYSFLRCEKLFLMNFYGGNYRKHLGGIYTSKNPLQLAELPYYTFKELYNFDKINSLRNLYEYYLKAYSYVYFKYSDNIKIKIIIRFYKECNYLNFSTRNKIILLIRITKALLIRFTRKMLYKNKH